MKLAKYRFVIRPKRELILPTYKGSTFRGGFGHAFKNAMCNARTGNCLECKDRYGCVYYYVFETANPSKAGGNLKNMQIPHPFVIEPSLDRSEHFGVDDELSFNLILIGKAIDYIPYFVLAFEELGRMGIGKNKGKYRLEEVFSLNGNEEMLIYDSKSHIKEGYEALDSNDIFLEFQKFDCSKVTLQFITPTRIKYDGRLTKEIDFEIFTRNLLRRLSWLSEIHCDEKWDLDWKGILDRSKKRVETVNSDLRWHDWERYSGRQDTKLKMGGFIGEITFEGDLAEFLPFIKLGEYLHIGKGTVHGLGRYEITGKLEQG